MDQNDKNNNYLLPISIIVAALLIAGAWIYTAGLKNVGNGKTPEKPAETSLNIENVAAVNSNDHIRGNLEAEVKIVEFSDLECPFCKSFHSTMKQVMEGYGDKVAWIYRHYPKPELRLSLPSARRNWAATKNSGLMLTVILRLRLPIIKLTSLNFRKSPRTLV